DFSAVPIAISAITPSTAAAGFGQMVAIDTNLSSLNNVSVTFSDGTTTEAGFIFPSPSTPQRLFVRLPTDGALTPGTLTVALMQGATQLATGQMTLSTTPGAPVIQYVMGLAVPPTANDCGTLTSTAPIGNISVGQGIAVDGLGIDTTNATLVFSQSGKDSLTVSEACSLSSNSYGMATVFTVPAGLSNGPVSLTLYVTVNGVQSTPSSAFAMNVVNPTYACIGSAFSILNTWNTGATGQPGNAPSFSTNGQTYCLDSIEDYHWNNHNGIAATSIGLTSVCELSCQSIGPFAAVNAGGATDGVAANWLMRPPNQVTINGTFTVVDTDSATWSYDAQNDPNNKTAFSNVMVKSAVVTTPPPIQ
ncbi:MAG TPA: hypothetical protein VI258_10685, partial [Rhodanobacteraceae bacterium]